MSEYIFRNNTNIGNLEAETDLFLNKCFIETEAYKTLSSFKDDNGNNLKRIIVGRTGSGKTALLEYIRKDSVISDQAELEAETTIFDYIKNNKFINNLMQNNVDLKIFFKALWNHVILVKVLTLLKENKTFLTQLKNKYKELETYIDKYEPTFFTDDALNIITETFQNDMEAKLNFKVLGLVGSSSNDRKKEIQGQTNAYVNQELLSKQRKIINYLKSDFRWDRQKKLFISIDDLDKSWIADFKIKYGFINSLMDSIREFLSLQNLKIIISIRTDILEGVYENNFRQEEKDLSLLMPLEWSKDEIRDLLDKRITYLLKDKYQKLVSPKLKDIFNFSINGEKADDFILNRTMLRPRDAIDFVNKCFCAANGKTTISSEDITTAEEYFFDSRKKALKDEWKALYPEIDTHIDILLKFIKKQTFNIEMLIKIKNDIKEKLIATNNMEDVVVEKAIGDKELVETLLAIWFKIGIIGIKKDKNVILYSSFSKRYLNVTDYEKDFYIHPLFWRR